ncbi:hypothetical protein V5799_003264 [Amblyomma americanum]|uniref:Uncharacterized protein n=1 Tax=Amblyomma americanum TaxID=6943 RepID=A0AAQ4D9G5_AMBAM
MLTVVSRKASTLSLNGMSAAQRDPVPVRMTIDAVLNMELDTEAAVSVMSKTQFRQLFISAFLKPTTVKLRAYTGALVRPQGLSSVDVQHGDHSAILSLYFVDHNGPPLLGAGSGSTPSGWNGENLEKDASRTGGEVPTPFQRRVRHDNGRPRGTFS